MLNKIIFIVIVIVIHCHPIIMVWFCFCFIDCIAFLGSNDNFFISNTFLSVYSIPYTRRAGTSEWVLQSGCLRVGTSERVPQCGCLRAGASEWVPQSGYLRVGASEWVPQSGCFRVGTSSTEESQVSHIRKKKNVSIKTTVPLFE